MDKKNDDDKIVSFEEKKKQKQAEEMIEKEMDNNSEVMDKMVDVLFSGMDDSLKSQLKDMLNSYGMRIGDEEKQEIDKILDSGELQKMVDGIEFDSSGKPILNNETVLAKNEELKEKYTGYRELFQWRQVYKPYTYDKFLLYEDAEKMAMELGEDTKEKQSKSELLHKICSHLKEYLQNQISYYDVSRMNWIAKLIYQNGVHHLSEPLTEEEEREVDYFESKKMFFRVNESGIKTLVMPKEMMDVVYSSDFTKTEKLIVVNTKIIAYVMGIANVYGVYPVDMAIDAISKKIKEDNSELFPSQEAFAEHFKNLMKASFGNMFLLKSYYAGINVSSDYIYHGTVGFAEQFRQMQQEYEYSYKELDFEELEKKGTLSYYEDSIHLSRAVEILKHENNFSKKDEDAVKSMIYVFSKLEFHPSTVLLYLDSMYSLPEKEEYDKLISSLEKINEVTEKWVLKGHFMGQKEKNTTNSEGQRADTSKIINIDFYNRGKKEDE